jgi:hypothetical protein
MSKNKISVKEIVFICGEVYLEQHQNKTFSNYMGYADEVRKRVSEKVNHTELLKQMRLECHITRVIECQLPVFELFYNETQGQTNY